MIENHMVLARANDTSDPRNAEDAPVCEHCKQGQGELLGKCNVCRDELYDCCKVQRCEHCNRLVCQGCAIRSEFLSETYCRFCFERMFPSVYRELADLRQETKAQADELESYQRTLNFVRELWDRRSEFFGSDREAAVLGLSAIAGLNMRVATGFVIRSERELSRRIQELLDNARRNAEVAA